MQDRQGVGLQNIVNRYGIVTDRRVKIDQDEKNFTVRIPILTKQITVMEMSTEYTDEAKAYYRAKKELKN